MIIQIIQFLLSLSLIVIIHEFGHFLFARLFKCRVEKFYLFFDWKFSLLKKKIGQTEYGIGWIPLGGYVKISGMVDESMDKDQLAEAPKPWEYRSKPAWQRFFIIIGGVMMNILMAMIIYIGLTFAYGDNYVATSDVKDGFEFSQTAQNIGFQNGDKIISVDGKTIDNARALTSEILLSDKRRVLIERNGEQKEITIKDADVKNLLKEKTFVLPRYPFIVGAPDVAGIFAEGDSLISIDSTQLLYADEFRAALLAKAGDSIDVTFARKGEVLTERVLISPEGKLGVMLMGKNIYPVTSKQYSFFEAIPAGINEGVGAVSSYFDQLGLIFSPKTEAYKEVGGFISMGKIFSDTWNWGHFWSITAILSIMIAVLNIMPIPALDGGHLVFIIYEMITRRAPSQKFMEVAQYVGFVLIIGLVILANGNDIIRLFQ